MKKILGYYGSGFVVEWDCLCKNDITKADFKIELLKMVKQVLF